MLSDAPDSDAILELYSAEQTARVVARGGPTFREIVQYADSAPRALYLVPASTVVHVLRTVLATAPGALRQAYLDLLNELLDTPVERTHVLAARAVGEYFVHGDTPALYDQLFQLYDKYPSALHGVAEQVVDQVLAHPDFAARYLHSVLSLHHGHDAVFDPLLRAGMRQLTQPHWRFFPARLFGPPGAGGRRRVLANIAAFLERNPDMLALHAPELVAALQDALDQARERRWTSGAGLLTYMHTRGRGGGAPERDAKRTRVARAGAGAGAGPGAADEEEHLLRLFDDPRMGPSRSIGRYVVTFTAESEQDE